MFFRGACVFWNIDQTLDAFHADECHGFPFGTGTASHNAGNEPPCPEDIRVHHDYEKFNNGAYQILLHVIEYALLLYNKQRASLSRTHGAG